MCSHPISPMLALSVDILAYTLPILAPNNPFALPSVQICCLQFTAKAREKPLTPAQMLWAGTGRSRLTCWVHVHPLHYCRASSSGYDMFEPPLLLKIVGLVPYLKDVSAIFRTCLWEVSWVLWEVILVPEGHVQRRGTWDWCWNRLSDCVLSLPAATCPWGLGGLAGGCTQSRYQSSWEHGLWGSKQRVPLQDVHQS